MMPDDLKEQSANAEYIAAFNPEVAQKLIASLREAEETLAMIQEESSQKYWITNDDGSHTNMWPAWARKQSGEALRKLRADWEG